MPPREKTMAPLSTWMSPRTFVAAFSPSVTLMPSFRFERDDLPPTDRRRRALRRCGRRRLSRDLAAIDHERVRRAVSLDEADLRVNATDENHALYVWAGDGDGRADEQRGRDTECCESRMSFSWLAHVAGPLVVDLDSESLPSPGKPQPPEM